MVNEPGEISTWLRAQPTLRGEATSIDTSSLSATPLALFTKWLREAADAGVPEPHAATLATVDAEGMPDARTLILKDVGDEGWAFAGLRDSDKGRQLAQNPVAALNFWWQPLVRAVRLRGRVVEASASESDADLAARSAAARQGVAPGGWVLWRLIPDHVEFWQGTTDRRHLRIRYSRTGDSWALHIVDPDD